MTDAKTAAWQQTQPALERLSDNHRWLAEAYWNHGWNAAIAAQIVAPVAPEGYQQVPVEPTEVELDVLHDGIRVERKTTFL